MLHSSPLVLGSLRLLPAGVALVAWGAANKRPQPSTGLAWLWILAFAFVDGAAFQVTHHTITSTSHLPNTLIAMDLIVSYMSQHLTLSCSTSHLVVLVPLLHHTRASCPRG